LIEARRAIRAGEPIDAALKAHADLDPMTVNLVRTGRASASLDEMLLFIADLNEEEARNRAKRLTSLAEPLAVLFIAADRRRDRRQPRDGDDEPVRRRALAHGACGVRGLRDF
jgi:hypothetical protein